MRYSINEKTRKPEGVPKGVKVNDRTGQVIENKGKKPDEENKAKPDEEAPSEPSEVSKEDKQKLAASSIDTGTRKEAFAKKKK